MAKMIPATQVQIEKPLMSSSSKATFISFIESKGDVSNSSKKTLHSAQAS
jgi:hypothetical protein